MSRLEVPYRWGSEPRQSRIVGILALIDRQTSTAWTSPAKLGIRRQPTCSNSPSDIDARDAVEIIEQVRDAVSRWPEFASAFGVPAERIRAIDTVLGPLIAAAAPPTGGASKAAGKAAGKTSPKPRPKKSR